MASAAAAAIANIRAMDVDAVFVALDEVDGAGHAGGSSSVGYRQAIETADSQVGQLLAAIANRPNFAEEQWQIVVTSDHGHRPTGGHGGQSDLERTIPLIVASQDANQGLLSTFPQTSSHADAAPTILDHFGVAIPEHYWGVSRASGSFVGSADINGDGTVSGDGTGPIESDDVTAFVSWWLVPNSLDNPNPADLNLDGIADISDWSILNAANPSMAAAVAAHLNRIAIPEPTTAVLTLLAFCVGPAVATRRSLRR